METQGSSLTSLQHQIMALVNGVDSHEQARLQNFQKVVRDNASNKHMYDEEQMRQQMIDLSKRLQEDMAKSNTNINFSYNDEIKSLVVTVRESTGQRIIREIPSEDAIELMLKMRDMVGNIFDERV